MNNNRSIVKLERSELVKLARAKRSVVVANDPNFFAAVSRAMFECDLIGINFGFNTDEYDPEAGTVIPRLDSCQSIDDVAQVLLEEFQAWFSEEIYVQPEAYRVLASDIWRLMNRSDANL